MNNKIWSLTVLIFFNTNINARAGIPIFRWGHIIKPLYPIENKDAITGESLHTHDDSWLYAIITTVDPETGTIKESYSKGLNILSFLLSQSKPEYLTLEEIHWKNSTLVEISRKYIIDQFKKGIPTPTLNGEPIISVNFYELSLGEDSLWDVSFWGHWNSYGLLETPYCKDIIKSFIDALEHHLRHKVTLPKV